MSFAGVIPGTVVNILPLKERSDVVILQTIPVLQDQLFEVAAEIFTGEDTPIPPPASFLSCALNLLILLYNNILL